LERFILIRLPFRNVWRFRYRNAVLFINNLGNRRNLRLKISVAAAPRLGEESYLAILQKYL
jgi:hypothetical protein